MVERPPILDRLALSLPTEVIAYVAALEAVAATVPVLQVQTQALQERVAALEARLGQSSTNSSRPPSADPPGTRPPTKPEPGRRRPGGQRGHRGQFRTLLPAEQVTQVERVVPAACAACGTALSEAVGPTDPQDLRHQVVEVPLAPATVTEYHLAARTCAACGQCTRATWPVGVPQGVVGPRLAAVIALLTGRYRLSKREAARALADLFGVELSVGTISAVEQQVSAALAPVVAEARAAVRAAAVASLDETGWRQGRQRAWLWTVVTALITVFHIDRSRGSQVVRMLLGPEWSGIVGSDRFAAYRWLAVEWRQVCWAHLRRDFQALVDWGPGPRPVGRQLLACQTQLFELWHRHRAGELDRAALVAASSRVAAEVRAVLETAVASGHPRAASLARELLGLWPALWTFVVVPGVEPTNNAAEQALRPAVLWRKGSFGTASDSGSRFVERLLTVTATCRQQHRPLLPFLVDAVTADHAGHPPPSLLPTT